MQACVGKVDNRSTSKLHDDTGSILISWSTSRSGNVGTLYSLQATCVQVEKVHAATAWEGRMVANCLDQDAW